MKRQFLIMIVMFALLVSSCGPAEPAAPTPTAAPTAPVVTPTTTPNVLSVDPAIALGPISPYLL